MFERDVPAARAPGKVTTRQTRSTTARRNKFRKVVVLDTVVFYPEHERVLASLVEKPVIERVPLTYDDRLCEWVLPHGYRLPENANIVIWPSSLPETFEHIPLAVHEKLRTAQCWAPAVLRENVSAQNVLNRIADACCVLTCWTNIPDEVLDFITPRAIITWTHEFEHRLNVDKARARGIYTNCVPDYGTEAVAELHWDSLLKLVERNKATSKAATTETDVLVGVMRRLFDRYRQAHVIEKNTRRGKFSHQFHKLGRSQAHYGAFRKRGLDNIIPNRLIEGKTIGLLRLDRRFDVLERVLAQGFRMHVGRHSAARHDDAAFYKFVAEHDTVVYDTPACDAQVRAKVQALRGVAAIDIQSLCHYEERLAGKTLGIIGLGRIGRAVARMAEPFGMKICYAGPRPKAVSYDYVPLDELLQTSDLVSVNVKAHAADGLLSEDKLALIQRGAYFINTSDGNAVEQRALTHRMSDDSLLAALDVYPGLPTTGTLGLDDNPVGKVKNQLANHVLTYRAGWITQESVRVKTYKLLGHMMAALQEDQASSRGTTQAAAS